MRRIIVFLRQVPLLTVTVLSVIPIALLWSVRPPALTLPAGFPQPSLGQWVVIVLAVITVVNALRTMVGDLRHGRPGVDVLAIIAILATLAVQEYWASWAVVLMVWSGDAIEEYAESKAGSNLSALVSAAPREAHLMTLPGTNADGAETTTDSRASSTGEPWRTVAAETVNIGDVLMVLPGETVPVDGSLMSGQATLDLSAINGEPLPRTVYAGARVMSGAVNGANAITVRATKLSRDSQYQHILTLVSSARDSRAPVVRTADTLAIPFTVLSLVIAAMAWILSADPARFAQVLVLATPCPLLIAAPVAYLAGTGKLAKAGILIKTQEVIENLARVSHVFFDKTGTLTSKRPHVLRVDLPVFSGHKLDPDADADADAGVLDPDHVLMLAGLVEGYSVHILSQGISTAGQQALQRLRDDGKASREFPVITSVNEDPGNGVSGDVDGRHVRVGRFDYVMADGHAPAAGESADRQVASAPDLRQSGRQTGEDEPDKRRGHEEFFPEDVCPPISPDEMTSYVSVDGRLAGRIVLRDTPRENAKQALAALHSLGVDKLTMVTGDRAASARTIAAEVGIGDVRSDLLPEDKLRAIQSDRGGRSGGKRGAMRPIAMMVGDGVNDAPVLAAADIGVAITDGTTTAASQSAQMVIMDDDIAAVPRSIAIARQTKRVMLQAVIIGLGLAVVGMLAAAFDLIPVVVGAFLQEVIDVISIMWALTVLTGHERDLGLD